MNNNLKQLPIQSLVDNGAKHMGLTDRDSASATAMQKPASQYIDTQGVKQILVLPKSSLIRSNTIQNTSGFEWGATKHPDKHPLSPLLQV